MPIKTTTDLFGSTKRLRAIILNLGESLEEDVSEAVEFLDKISSKFN